MWEPDLALAEVAVFGGGGFIAGGRDVYWPCWRGRCWPLLWDADSVQAKAVDLGAVALLAAGCFLVETDSVQTGAA